MKVLLVCDNRDVVNWGCRATSMALHSLLQRKFTIAGVVGRNDVIAVKPIGRLAKTKLYGGVTRRLRLDSAMQLLGQYRDFCLDDIEKGVDLVLQNTTRDPFFLNLVQKVEAVDAVVINGEGSMVFKERERKDLRFQLLIISLAKRLGKQAFYINAMISDFPGAGRNNLTYEKCIRYLSMCSGVQVRDKESLRIVEDRITASNIKYRPDALFSWFGADWIGRNDINERFMVPHPENEDRLNWRFREPYICIGGSSFYRANNKEDHGADYFSALVKEIKKLGMPIYLVESCTGDRFLRKVANDEDVKFVPVDTNIFSCANILANAQAFISGRYHPGIMASLGGTPCVFFESNSHKTKSLQEVLCYQMQREYSLSDRSEINEIRSAVERCLSDAGARRKEILDRVADLAVEAKKIPDFVQDRFRC